MKKRKILNSRRKRHSSNNMKIKSLGKIPGLFYFTEYFIF